MIRRPVGSQRQFEGMVEEEVKVKGVTDFRGPEAAVAEEISLMRAGFFSNGG